MSFAGFARLVLVVGVIATVVVAVDWVIASV
jgi:hypothetical protein